MQLLLKRSGFGTGRDRWCIRGVRRVSSPCTLVRLASSSWGSQHSRHILRGRCCGSRRRLSQRGPQTCGMAALHCHIRDELLQVIIGDVLERGERVPAVLVEGGQCTSYEDSSCLARKVAVV